MTNATSYGALSRAPAALTDKSEPTTRIARLPALRLARTLVPRRTALTLLRICQYRHTGDPGMFDGRHHFCDRPVRNPFIGTQVQ
jgi:hypothetical protein